MAFYIEVVKSAEENDSFAYYVYQFSCPAHKIKTSSGKIRYKSKEVQGTLKIDKRNGDVYAIELAEGDNGAYVKRAGWALMKHWKKGEFPEKTCWAS